MFPVQMRPTWVVLVVLSLSACDRSIDRVVSPTALISSPVHHRSSLAPGDVRTILGPRLFMRTTSAPITESVALEGYAPDATLRIANGDGNGRHRVTSGTVLVDGQEVVHPSDFNKQVAAISVPITLRNTSVISVRLTGAPGDQLTLSVDGQIATSAALPSSGGTVHLLGSQVTLDVPAGAVSANTEVTVEQLPTGLADARVVGSVYEFGPDGTSFDPPVTITLRYDPTDLPVGVSPRLLRLHTFVSGYWQLVPGSTVDTDNGTVSGETAHFSTYAVLPAAFVMVSSGERHSCALTSSGSAWCWGDNFSGQLGAVTTEICASTRPCATQAVEVQGGLTFQNIEAGNQFTCGVVTSGEAYCWGANSSGQLGNGSTTPSSVPTLAAAGLAFSSISAELSLACGVTTAGHVYCWGSNTVGQLAGPVATTCLVGTQLQPCSTVPVRVPIPDANQIDVGLSHACALTTLNDVYCWGWNVFGQVGTGTTSSSAPPTLLAGGPYATLSTGAIHNCVTRTGGDAWCFGTDYRRTGALGDGTNTTRLTPTLVAGGLAFSQIDASNGNYIFTHTCGVTVAGATYCWGANLDGQLGVPTAPLTCTSTFAGALSYDCAASPIAVAGGHSFTYVTAGAGNTCGYTTAGDIYCWGRNGFGELGNGTTTGSRIPIRVATAP